jgi:thiol-disulfide isomerase/thioredoxin
MKGKSGILYVVALAAFAAVVLYLSFGGTSDTSDYQTTELNQEVAVNQQPYLLGMEDLEGNAVDMKKEELVFLNVWATWCGPCVMEMPGIQSLYERYKSDTRVGFYIVSDEDAETVIPFVKRKGYDLPFYVYQNRFPGVLDGNSIPRTYIIYKGRVLTQGIGAANWDTPEVHQLIDSALEGA